MNVVLPVDMLGIYAAEQIGALRAVRPVTAGRPDKFPNAVYQTYRSTSGKRPLNCSTSVRDVGMRILVADHNYDTVVSVAEQLKTLFLAYPDTTGTAYRIRRVSLEDETDVYEDESDPKFLIYVKSLDFGIKALAL